jgi:hypothetical protein
MPAARVPVKSLERCLERNSTVLPELHLMKAFMSHYFYTCPIFSYISLLIFARGVEISVMCISHPESGKDTSEPRSRTLE